MSIGKRLLWLVLLLTIAAAFWPLPQDDVADKASPRPSANRNRAAVLDAIPAPHLRRLTAASASAQGEIVDLFPGQSFTAPLASATPEKPTAPPLPFTYGGSYTEGSKLFVFLKEGDKIHTVRLGDTVNANYRIDNIAPTAITLTYLPLGQQQMLQTGSTTRP